MQKPKPAELEGIGTRVKEGRRRLELTQEQLAERAGTSKSFVSEIENGQSPANGLTYLRIARALEMGVEYLLTGQAPEPLPPVRSEPNILADVARLAEEHGWSYREAAEISAQVNAVVARRTRNGEKWKPSEEYLRRLHEALRIDEADD